MLRLNLLTGFGEDSQTTALRRLQFSGTGVFTGAGIATVESVFAASGAGLFSGAGSAEATAELAASGSGSYVNKAPIAWDPTTVTAVTLSGNDLIATNTGTTSTNQGVRGASGNAKGNTVKLYIEYTFTTIAGGGNYGAGTGTPISTYSNMATANQGGMVFRSGNIWGANANSGKTLGARSSGDVIGMAVDYTVSKIWFRVAPSGDWNGDAAADPTTNTGGATISGGNQVPFAIFGGTGGVANNVITANFGAAPFVGTPPSGFTPGWFAA